jgi:hypothetical protein
MFNAKWQSEYAKKKFLLQKLLTRPTAIIQSSTISGVHGGARFNVHLHIVDLGFLKNVWRDPVKNF